MKDMLSLMRVGSSLDNVYWTLALIGTALFVIKLILMLLGGDHGADHGGDAQVDVTGADADVAGAHGDVGDHGADHVDSDSSFKLLSLQSILSFFMGFGWMGLAAQEFGAGAFVAFVSAMAFGLAMMALNAWLMMMMLKLNKVVKFDIYSCIGSRGKVYLTIPEHGKGTGQVDVTINGRKMIMNAISSNKPIETYRNVMIISVEGDDTLVVEETED